MKPQAKLVLLIFITFLYGCSSSSKESVKNISDDLNTLCESYNIQNWSHIDKSISLKELNQLVEQSIKAKVSTMEVKGIINDIADTKFYRSIYPDTKRKVEALIGHGWDCENLKTFYSLKITPVDQNGNDAKSETENKNAIIITASGNYIFNGMAIGLSNLHKIESNLDKTNKTIVTMQLGSDEDQLQQLFTVLSQLGISSVSVLSE